MNEINALDARITKIKRQIELPTTESDLKYQMSDFLQAAENKMQMLQRGMKEVEALRLQLAEFFCEDPNSFKLEECFKIFQTFCEKFKLAVNENERRRLQEEQAIIRRKLREEQLARRARQSQAGTPVSDSDNSLMFDASQLDIRASPAMARRRMGSFNSSGEHGGRDDGFSPGFVSINFIFDEDFEAETLQSLETHFSFRYYTNGQSAAPSQSCPQWRGR